MKQLRNKEIKELIQQFSEQYNIEYSKKEDFVQHDNILLINGEPDFFMHKNQWYPTCKLLLKSIVLPKITIDMGAVRFVVNGADIMRPGITDIDEEVKKGKPAAIVDETHGKPLSVGLAKFDAQEMRSKNKGNVVQNLHWVGDEIWNKN